MTSALRLSPRIVFAAGAALTALAVGGALRVTSSLAAQEGSVTETVPEGALRHSLPRIALRARGSVRATVCAPHGDDAGGTLVVSGRQVPLVRGASSVARCTAASWQAAAARQVDVSIAFTRPAPRGTTLTLRHGGSLGAHNALPFAALLLGVALLVLAPLAGPQTAPSLRPVTDGAEIARGIVRAVAGVALAHLAATGVFLQSGGGALAMLGAVLAQNAGIILAAAWASGALERGALRREALELVPPPRMELLRALVVGGLLVAIAVLLSARLKDPGDTPIGQDIEQMPLRYVIVFGGLLAPLGEELFYRGVLGRLSARLGRAAVVLLPALVFTAMHVAQLKGSALALVPIAGVGVVNGLVRLGTRGVVAPWLVHTTYNAALVSSAFLAE
jgi:membrane protease YdiL (CAAX protease family)